MERMIVVLLAVVACVAAQNRGVRLFATMRLPNGRNVAGFQLTQPNRLAPITSDGLICPAILPGMYSLVVLEGRQGDCHNFRPARLPNFMVNPGTRQTNLIRSATLARGQVRSIRGRAIGLIPIEDFYHFSPNYNARSIACGWVDSVQTDTLPCSTFKSFRNYGGRRP